MDAVEFLKERTRMCNFYMSRCMNCPGNKVAYCATLCAAAIELVPIVEQWSKEHPIKTRQSEFLKMFPNAQKSSNGVLDICPRKFEPEKYKSATPDKVCINCDTVHWCDECCRDFWLAEIKDGEA